MIKANIYNGIKLRFYEYSKRDEEYRKYDQGYEVVVQPLQLRATTGR